MLQAVCCALGEVRRGKAPLRSALVLEGYFEGAGSRVRHSHARKASNDR